MNKFFIGSIATVLLISPFVGSMFFGVNKDTIQFNSLAPTSTIHIDGSSFLVAVADMYKKRSTGLSNVESLPENHGLLFVFTTSDLYRIWMKEMNFPIDVIWFDKDFRVIDITKNISPDSYPSTFHPKSPARYFLEVKAGSAEAHEIKIGSVAVFERR